MPLFQNESLCKTFHMKTSLICMKMNLLGEPFLCEWFRTKNRFDTEVNENGLSLTLYGGVDKPRHQQRQQLLKVMQEALQ